MRVHALTTNNRMSETHFTHYVYTEGGKYNFVSVWWKCDLVPSCRHVTTTFKYWYDEVTRGSRVRDPRFGLSDQLPTKPPTRDRVKLREQWTRLQSSKWIIKHLPLAGKTIEYNYLPLTVMCVGWMQLCLFVKCQVAVRRFSVLCSIISLEYWLIIRPDVVNRR